MKKAKDKNQIGFDFNSLSTIELKPLTPIKNEGIKNVDLDINNTKIIDMPKKNNIKELSSELSTVNNIDIDNFDIDAELDNDIFDNEDNTSYVPTNRDLYAKDLGTVNADTLTLEEEIEYFKKIHNGDQKAKEEFINKNLKLVVSVAKKYSSYTTSFSDLDIIQEGNLGLLKAVEKFDPTKGNKFSTCAVWWINQTIKRALEDKTRFVRIPNHRVQQINKINKFVESYKAEHHETPTIEEIASQLNCKTISVKKALDCNMNVTSMNVNYTSDKESELGEILTDGNTIEDVFVQREDYSNLYAGFNKLNDLEKQIITMHIINKHKISHIERMLNLKRSQINKTIETALSKMRKEFVG